MIGRRFSGPSRGSARQSGGTDALVRGPAGGAVGLPAVASALPSYTAGNCTGTAGQRRGRRVVILLSAIVVLSLADLLVTLTHLTTTGMMEANPVAAWLIRTTQSPWSLMALKLCSVGTAVFVLYHLRQRIQGEIGSWCALGILVVVAFLWHTYSQNFDSPQDVQLAQSGFYGDNWMILEWSAPGS